MALTPMITREMAERLPFLFRENKSIKEIADLFKLDPVLVTYLYHQWVSKKKRLLSIFRPSTQPSYYIGNGSCCR